MAIRTTLYGYQVKNGKTVVHDEESEVVKEVFSLYVEGNTLNSIASMLTEKKIVYFQDEVKWNKNTINRMLENEKYYLLHGGNTPLDGNRAVHVVLEIFVQGIDGP